MKGVTFSKPDKNFQLMVHLKFIKKDYKAIISYVNATTLIQLYGKGESWDNSEAWTLYRIGEAYYNTGDFSNAQTFYFEACALAKHNPEFLNKLGASCMAQKNYSGGRQGFEDALKEDPKYVSALSNLGYVYLLSGNVVKAEELYNRALKLDPDYESLLMNFAGLKIYQKKYKEAENVLNNIIKKNPKNEQAKMVLSQLKGLK